MTASVAEHADVYTDFQGLKRLRAEAQRESPEALKEVARQFEALFIQMMVKSMREASLSEGIMDNDQSKLYQGMYDQQLSLELSKGKGLGLADTLVRQLSRGVGSSGEQYALPSPQQLAVQRVAPTATSSVAPVADVSAWQVSGPEDFVAKLWPHAQRAAAQLGTRPEVLVAQAALETGWGKSVMQHGDGHSSFNLFGIKADARWDGDRVYAQTMEFRDGVMGRERAAFRSYDSVQQSFSDYVDFLKQNPRYQDALAVGRDSARYAQELQRAGYATDPHYADKISSILGGAEMAKAWSAING